MFRVSFFVIFFIFISCNSNPTGNNNQAFLLTDKTWELVSLNYFGVSKLVVEKSEFTIFFSDSGTMKSKMDRNNCSGEYSVKVNNVISINTGACTKVLCGPNSKDFEVNRALNNATTYFIDDKKLRIFYGIYYLFFKSK